MAVKDTMLTEVKAELGDNYITGDDSVLEVIISRIADTALSIANRTNTEANLTLLYPEIYDCVKTTYLQRGAEDVDKRSAQGDDSTYRNAYNYLYKQIVNHNKRLVL